MRILCRVVLNDCPVFPITCIRSGCSSVCNRVYFQPITQYSLSFYLGLQSKSNEWFKSASPSRNGPSTATIPLPIPTKTSSITRSNGIKRTTCWIESSSDQLYHRWCITVRRFSSSRNERVSLCCRSWLHRAGSSNGTTTLIVDVQEASRHASENSGGYLMDCPDDRYVDELSTATFHLSHWSFLHTIVWACLIGARLSTRIWTLCGNHTSFLHWSWDPSLENSCT